MPKPIQLFLEWEIKVKLDYLHEPMSRFAVNVSAYNAAILAQLPITVNQFRRDLGVSPHPDSRGEMYVWEENKDQPGDSIIPDGLLKAAWDQIALLESHIQIGGRKTEQLAEAYPELYKASTDKI